MADTEAPAADSANAEAHSPEKKKKRDVKPKEKSDKPKSKRNLDNPPMHDMIVEALEVLQDRKGVTLQAIKRYLEENYKVDASKLSPHIRRALIHGVDDGNIIRTRGQGAFGRFKVKITHRTAKKRQAPENYIELPMINKHKPRPTKSSPKNPASEQDAPQAKETPTKSSPKAKETPTKSSPKAKETPKKTSPTKRGRHARK